MPRYFAAGKYTRMVSTRTTVGPDGSARDCNAEHSSGDAYLDSYTCGIIMKRARFQPAKWLDGTPVYGVLHIPVVWATMTFDPLFDAEQIAQPDMELFVNRLPKGARKRVMVNFMFAADEAGHLVSCTRALPLSKHAKPFPELVALGCQELTRQWVAIPPRDASGKAVRSVQNAEVAFTVKR